MENRNNTAKYRKDWKDKRKNKNKKEKDKNFLFPPQKLSKKKM